MNSKGLIFVAMFFLTSAFALAKTITVKVNGMVCAFCAQGIEKKFKALPEISSIKISLETKNVDLVTKNGKDLSDDKITEIISEAGYDVLKIERAK
jgi:copper chaperone CopZ